MTAERTIVVVGDAVLDRDVVGRTERICPDAPVPVLDVEAETSGPGGAGLAALLCRAPGTSVTFVTPLGDDEPGHELRAALEAAGVSVVPLRQAGPTRRKTRVRSLGQSLLRIDDGGPGTPLGPLPAEALTAIDEADVVLVSCYGAGTTAHQQLRERLTVRATGRPVLWDPHPRGGAPVPGCTLVSPNLAEARAETGMPDGSGDQVARRLREHWSAAAVCVTAGASGAWLAASAGEPVYVPAVPAEGDPCGAGDRFIAAAANAVAHGRTTSEAVATAVESASAFVAAGGASGFRHRQEHPTPSPAAARETGPAAGGAEGAVVDRVRAAGGAVVATGGCFDILHAGHVSCLEAARSLGDALVVLLNSDASVRRLKGPGRPVQPAADRARVLQGLSCVDAVVVFDEDTPERALAELRPDVWVKGGDYEGAELAEAELVRGWGGRVVLLPYLSGRSTTAILADVR
ncbi:D-glycero-beta-D-manno-heptose 1-phosphate adenylyltransferase [Phycicoccus sp. SLBN-51]|uniref:D-glycero-beta-D-manno-heptose 1-phosphate adenylyltransferase n=1 Tax=Phycicoccus sp. SLBN-51 TaxID=2768447 RepID=UPI00114D6CC3|nr:D-glycero-beta-D-manno-heptose 1-phosphate adenylyltransferase [Phycicoccus sp. SLBN-51]TQJ50087.1 rfaE bifunctional protein kinase chain/domain/rfaE bifunctional protein nucleotidyltransferase chain/domain [Phycicoccus sp. SLBN-51]